MTKANRSIIQRNRIAALEERIRAEAVAKNHLLAAIAIRYGSGGRLELTDADFAAVSFDATLKVEAGPEGKGGVVIIAGKLEPEANTPAATTTGAV